MGLSLPGYNGGGKGRGRRERCMVLYPFFGERGRTLCVCALVLVLVLYLSLTWIPGANAPPHHHITRATTPPHHTLTPSHHHTTPCSHHHDGWPHTPLPLCSTQLSPNCHHPFQPKLAIPIAIHTSVSNQASTLDSGTSRVGPGFRPPAGWAQGLGHQPGGPRV